ncbi:DEAD/DEAH box helicase [Pseudomonas panipatensis]|uniref:UvrD/REP helicase N-terminal domain-containing protein n=1 Tax=Pseudomonas panipatensis TaxID=428992 RepID=A0A1G8GF07_9PSED|nr:DEAD/DEAH box helicase [Pseudomonas panipatensis]SDH92945.1 UvrD/REP helicase N-terminal domain-containing protein [Pseudomonas panipatensis]SMP43673.1 UvrD/REP helicase N-terminal domain-containing protein [Pseudomonas panipatensis]
MLSAVRRYKLLLAESLARYFPRTTAYLREQGQAAPPAAHGKRPAAKARAKKAGACAQDENATAKPRRRKAAEGTAAPRATQPASAGIYPARALPVDASQEQAMRARVAQAVSAGVLSPPSDEQWAMILCRQPLTRIFAGAGSGKSTTLVLRVVFMLCHLGIEAERITVISFTNASCAQLREQLQRVLGFWSFPFDQAQAHQCVRTFHSAMGGLAKALLGNPRWFEQLDERNPDEPDNPLTGGRLRPAQQRLLQQAYSECYAASAVFRGKVHRLLGLPKPAEEAVGAAPLEPFKLAGEFAAVPLFEAFYVQAGFMESLGLRPESLGKAELACATREKIFLEALALFWSFFLALLRKQRLMTFNAAFQQLTERLNDGAAPLEAVQPFSHLLIDEFQDISPQIVLWLQAVQRHLSRQGQAPSLMAIGDDWQSIYGWRGSSPELFMDFDRHFPSKGRNRKSTVLLLETNYRSIEPVIRDAEAVLAEVRFKQAKHSRAFKAMQPGDHGVRLVQPFDLKTQMPALLREIQAQCAHVEAGSSRERTAVLLLSRRNEPLQQIQAQLDRAWPVKAMSIHRAKGLQAEVAIIVDDCAPVEKHPLRNALYAHCGFFRNSYDQAMQDESLRLAYVAITRGVSRVFWYTRKVQGATALLGRRG